MLHVAGDRPVTFLHGALNGDHHAFKDEVNSLVEQNEHAQCHFKYSSPTEQDRLRGNSDSEGVFTREFIADYLTAETDVYFCGPKVMMKSVYKALSELGHPMEKMNYEFFGPQEEIESP